MANSYRTVGDYLSSLESFYSSQTFDKKIYSPEEIVENINKVSKEDIIEASKKITLDTIYALVGESI